MKLLPLEDPRWKAYRGGYNGVRFDVTPLIRELHSQGFSESWWEKLWDELHHQGDVGEASYAIVPYLVEYQGAQRDLEEQLFHFAAVIELARPEGENPPVPPEVELSYETALRKLPAIGAEKMRRGCTPYLVMGIAALTALAAGQRLLARAYLDFGRDAALAFLEQEYGYAPSPDET